MDDIVQLAQSDLQSATWVKLSAHMRHRVDMLRKKNDDATLTAEETSAIRAKIAVYRALLDLEKDVTAGFDGRQFSPTREALDY